MRRALRCQPAWAPRRPFPAQQGVLASPLGACVMALPRHYVAVTQFPTLNTGNLLSMRVPRQSERVKASPWAGLPACLGQTGLAQRFSLRPEARHRPGASKRSPAGALGPVSRAFGRPGGHPGDPAPSRPPPRTVLGSPNATALGHWALAHAGPIHLACHGFAQQPASASATGSVLPALRTHQLLPSVAFGEIRGIACFHRFAATGSGPVRAGRLNGHRDADVHVT